MNSEPMAMTVLGPVSGDVLGPTLTHEHLLIDMSCYWQEPREMSMRRFADEPVSLENLTLVKRNPLVNHDNCLLDDIELAITELTDFVRLGGRTIVDVTLPDIGRDPLALQAAARSTGLNVIAGCGHYVHLAHPETLNRETVDQVAERLVDEIRLGIGDTGVRPGIIGELGTSHPIHPREAKVLRAAASAQQETGLAITLHLHPPTRSGEDVLTVLAEAGADMERVIAGHVDIALGHLDIGPAQALDYYRRLLEHGCVLEFDTVGNTAYFANSGYGSAFWCPTDAERATMLKRLIEEGYGDRLVLAHDVCHKYHLKAFGGVGYGHILRDFRTDLSRANVGSEDIERLLITNPRRLLEIGKTGH